MDLDKTVKLVSAASDKPLDGQTSLTLFDAVRRWTDDEGAGDYAIESEGRIWDWTRITAHLSGYAVVRQVDHRGFVSIYNRGRYVGKIHQGKSVHVMFDPESNEWLFADAKGHYLSRKPADELSPERVLDLNVTRRQ